MKNLVISNAVFRNIFEDKRASSLNGLGDDMVMNQLANLFDNIQGL